MAIYVQQPQTCKNRKVVAWKYGVNIICSSDAGNKFRIYCFRVIFTRKGFGRYPLHVWGGLMWSWGWLVVSTTRNLRHQRSKLHIYIYRHIYIDRHVCIYVYIMCKGPQLRLKKWSNIWDAPAGHEPRRSTKARCPAQRPVRRWNKRSMEIVL